MRRDLLRMWQEWKRRVNSRSASPSGGTEHGSLLQRLNSLRWWVIPVVATAFIVLAGWQLLWATSAQEAPHTFLLFDAPLPDPLRWRFSSRSDGLYFKLQRDPQTHRLLAQDPQPGTRAFRGGDAVPIFGAQSRNAEIYLSPCQTDLPSEAVVIVTPDGLKLWPCLQANEENIEIHRIGWRFSTSQWSNGMTLGRSANNEMVLGSALLPSRALHLELSNGQLQVKPWEAIQGTPSTQRLVCLKTLSSTQPPATNTTASTNQPPAPTTCPQAPLKLATGQGFVVYTKHHPGRTVRLRWKASQQEQGMYDLQLEPVTGHGRTIRRLGARAQLTTNSQSFAVGNALMYFARYVPGSVRTLDLDEKVNDLILRKALVYLGPDQLRNQLQNHQSNTLDLEKLAQQAPIPSLQPHLRELYENRYLRNRIWMANHSLANRYRQQARSLFRLRFPTTARQGELLGLGFGGSALQAPKRNLAKFSTVEQPTTVDLRLRTILTAQRAGTAYLMPLDEDGKPEYETVHFVGKRPLELLTTSTPPPQLTSRRWMPAKAATHATALLYVGSNLYQSTAPIAYLPPTARVTKTDPSKPPTQFLYHVQGRWWKRNKTLQRSSRDWTVEAVARKLGTLLTQEKLAEALKTLNTGRWKERKHCGNESRRSGRRWKHGSRCWGTASLFASGKQILVPCSPLVKSRLRERYCKPGRPTPRLDQRGRIIQRPITALQDLYGAVFVPYHHNTTLSVPLTSSTSSTHQRGCHSLRALPGSRPILVDGQPVPAKTAVMLRHGTRLQIGTKMFRYDCPDGTLALAKYRREYIVPHYPEGPVFSHAIAGSVGGPFRGSPSSLKKQLPPPPTSKAATPPKSGKPIPQNAKNRKIATTLHPDVQRIAFAVARRHFARLDSEAFKKRFRRRYIRNTNKPHAGSVVILDRTNGRVLASLSFPTFDPNLPEEENTKNSPKPHRYLQGQLLDPYGITDDLLAYDPMKLPPIRPPRQKKEGKPAPIPHYLEAVAWDKAEAENYRGDQRSGWLLERALRGGQTPGSTAKIVTALAYARFLRKQGKPVRFPAHHCHGGMMFMRERQRGNRRGWKPSTIRFRCHRRQGHGALTLQQALAVSCNVYFAKLALEMAGVPAQLLRSGKVQWLSNQYGGTGRYQFLNIPRRTLSDAMGSKPIHRTLFRTAAQLGFSMRYRYQLPNKQVGRYSDIFWEAGDPAWKQPDTSLPAKEQRRFALEQLQTRLRTYLPHNYFGVGRFFGFSSAYPAWQQWVHSSQDPRFGKRAAVQQTFGSTDASLRAMAYIGFGQNLIASPLRLAHIAGVIANGGWMPFPRFWLGDWDKSGPPPKDRTQMARPKPQRVVNVNDAKTIQKALATVTNQGTASRPFRNLNSQCLKDYGIQVIGKTGTAETRSQRSREYLRKEVRRKGRLHWHSGSRGKFIRESGCHSRRFWRYDSPEENIADSLFVGAISALPSSAAGQSLPGSPGWNLRNLAFAVVVKNGYHPEGAPCVGRHRGRTVDLDRSEAKYLAHDILVALLQHNGVCAEYDDYSQYQKTTPFTKLVTRMKRQARRKRRKTRRRRRRARRRVRKRIRKKRRRVRRRRRRTRRHRRVRRTRRRTP